MSRWVNFVIVVPLALFCKRNAGLLLLNVDSWFLTSREEKKSRCSRRPDLGREKEN